MNELVGKETIYLAAGYLAVLLLLYNYFTKRNLLRCIIEGFINVSGKVKGEVSAELGGSKIKKIYDKHKFMCDLLTYFCACVFIAWITLENTLALVQDIVLFRNHECEVLVGTVETTSDDNSVLMLSLAVMISLCHADMRLPGYLSWNVSCDGAAIRPYHGRA